MEDAHQTIGKGTESLMVGLAAAAEAVVVATSTR